MRGDVCWYRFRPPDKRFRLLHRKCHQLAA
jgi:hypothetical protein